MQSKKPTQTAPSRTSGVASVNARRVSESVTTPDISSADLIAPVTTSSPTSVAADPVVASSSDAFYKPPLLMTPVSQISRGPRRQSRPDFSTSDRSVLFDPAQYNPDGSLKTVHQLPGFDQSYAQAMQARYVRHKELMDREKELSINEIFGRKDKK